MNDEISPGNLALVRHRTPHRRVAEGKGQMDLLRLAYRHVAQSEFDAVGMVKIAFTNKK